ACSSGRNGPPDVGNAFDESYAPRVGLPRREKRLTRLGLRQSPPHSLNIVSRMAPIAFGIQIPKKKRFLSTELNSCDCTANFSGDESLAADRAFMIEQDSV